MGLAVLGLALIAKAAYDLNAPFKQFVDTFPRRLSRFWNQLQTEAGAAIQLVIKWWRDLQKAATALSASIKGSGRFWSKLRSRAATVFKALGLNLDDFLRGTNTSLMP